CALAIVCGARPKLLPALVAAVPRSHPATRLGVNNGAAVWGTAVATRQYARRVDLRWAALLPAAAAGFAGSLAGAWLVTVISPGFLRKALPIVLLAVLLYTLVKKDLAATTRRALPAGPKSRRPAALAWRWAFTMAF